MEGPHPCTHLIDRGTDRARVGEARAIHRPPEDAQLPLLVRDQVGATHTRQLRTVLDGAQEAIARCELISITASDIAAVPQRLDRLQRRAHTQESVRSAVDELEELDREFDVAQAAAAELEFARGV